MNDETSSEEMSDEDTGNRTTNDYKDNKSLLMSKPKTNRPISQTTRIGKIINMNYDDYEHNINAAGLNPDLAEAYI